MVVKWTFLDTVTSESYTFEINPTKPISPSYTKNIAYQGNVAPDDKTILVERDTPQEINFSGTILTEAEYTAFETWWAKEVPITIVDDLARTFTVMIKEFLPKRERSLDYPWKHSYDINALTVVELVTGPGSVAIPEFDFFIGIRT